jgi:hypothetical protein
MTDPIESVIRRLGRELGGFGPRRAAVLTEVRDGLEDAADAYRSAGLPGGEARRRAVADFGDLGVVARHYRDTELGRLGRQTAVLLGTGPVLVLMAWLLLGVAQGGLLVDGLDTGFGLITLAAAGAAGLGGWWTRRTLRRNEHPAPAARTVAIVMVALCGFTWVFSYAVEPWTTPADVRATGWQWVHLVEVFSMVMTAAMLGTALRCLVALRRA